MEPLEEFSYIPKVERRYDLDWLRIISIILVFFYHCTMIFQWAYWVINDSNLVELSATRLKAYMSIGTSFVLPLFFVIGGMGTFYALNYMLKQENIHFLEL